MSTGRLGKGKTAVDKLIEGELVVTKHNSMGEALDFAIKGAAHQSSLKGKSHHRLTPAQLGECLTGNGRLPALVEQADSIIDQAIIIDPRLNRRHGWVRAEEGIDACPALIASGEPACCLDRRRIRLAEASGMDPIRVVLSTDSTDDARESNVLAFIAAAKMAQQFRPLEIWWQGAWLLPDGTGQVMLAPLVQGDLDFARVQFFLSSPIRDTFSYRCMWYHACTKHCVGRKTVAYKYGGERGAYSHLENTTHFVSEKGMDHSPEGVARMAARWAGMEPRYVTAISEYGAEQSWAPTSTSIIGASKPTKADERRWEQESARRRREREREEIKAQRSRMAAVG